MLFEQIAINVKYKHVCDLEQVKMSFEQDKPLSEQVKKSFEQMVTNI